MTQNKTLNPIIFQSKPWCENSNLIWLASTVKLARNIEKFKFPAKLELSRKQMLITLMEKIILSKEVISSAKLVHPQLIKAEEINAFEKEFLVEHFLSNQSYNESSNGESFILDETGECLISLNINDHLSLQFLDCRSEIEETWNRLINLEIALGKQLLFAFSKRFGFLTADPNTCGTALKVSIYLQLTGLIHSGKIDAVLEKLADESLVISGMQGDPNEIIGDVIMVENNYTLGFTEENIISTLRNFTTKILIEERKARSELIKSNNDDFKDKISRAYGILIHSYQIEAIEALNALSLLKIGCEAGWISGIDNRALNELFFNCRRAHLLYQYKESVVQEEIPHKRAERIHKALKDVKLLV